MLFTGSDSKLDSRFVLHGFISHSLNKNVIIKKVLYRIDITSGNCATSGSIFYRKCWSGMVFCKAAGDVTGPSKGGVGEDANKRLS